MIDLHTHSTASDGSLSPAELIDEAVRRKLTAIALTDHDTVHGLAPFLKRAESYPITAVTGVEISCSWYGGSLHIVALFVNPQSAVLLELLQKLQDERIVRNEQILQRLLDHGIDISPALLQEMAGTGLTGRPHIAEVMVQQGAVQNRLEAFDRYLGKGKRAFVARYLPKPAEVIACVHAAGGITIWAHPFAMGRRPTGKVRKIALYLRDLGLDGIETYYSEYTEKQQQDAHRIAQQLGLLMSGGSDFHGSFSAGIALGSGRGNLLVPDELMPPLQRRKERILHGAQ